MPRRNRRHVQVFYGVVCAAGLDCQNHPIESILSPFCVPFLLEGGRVFGAGFLAFESIQAGDAMK